MESEVIPKFFCTNPKGESKNFQCHRGLQEFVRPESGIYFLVYIFSTCRARGMSIDPKQRHFCHRSLFCNSSLVRMTQFLHYSHHLHLKSYYTYTRGLDAVLAFDFEGINTTLRSESFLKSSVILKIFALAFQARAKIFSMTSDSKKLFTGTEWYDILPYAEISL